MARVRRLRVEDLERIDERIGASLEQLDKFNPDELVWAVERAADEFDGARKVERREQRAVESSFLAIQPSFDGSLRLYGELDPIAGATCLNAIDAASDPPVSEQGEPGHASGRARQRAQGLTRICSDWLGGNNGRRSRPLLVAHVDVANVTPTAAGTVELATPGVLPTLTAAAIERLTRDADLRVVLFDGARPLAVSAKTRAADIPSDTRLAVAGRDRGCRFPGSTTPQKWADLHHIVPREQGGEHHPENLAHLARRWHRLVHRQGWEQHLDPDTGEFTVTRNGRTWHSLPRGTPLDRPPPPPRPPD